MALVLYDRLYRKKAMRRAAHFIKPRILDANEFDFPVGSVFHWWKPDENINFLTKEYGYLTRVDKAQVESFFDYPEGKAEGRFVNRTFLVNGYITENAKKCKEFKFLKPNQTINIPERTLKIANYGAISGKYRYTTHPMKPYYIHKNTFTSVLSNLWKTGRRVFLLFDIPSELPTRIELEKFSRRLLPGQISKLPTLKHFNVLDLWKFLTPELHKESILYNIPRDKFKDVNLLFSIDNKLMFININFMLANIKEFGIEAPGTRPKSALVFKKIIYFMLQKFIKSAAMTESEIDKQEEEIDANSSHYDKAIDKVEETTEEEDVKEDTIDKIEEQPKEEKQEGVKVNDGTKENMKTSPKTKLAGGNLISRIMNNNQKDNSLMARLRNKSYQDNQAIDEEIEDLINSDKELEEIDELLEDDYKKVDELDANIEDLLDEEQKEEELDADEIEEQPTLLDTSINKTEIVETTEFKSLDEIRNEEPNFKDGITKKLEYLQENKVLTKKQVEKTIATIDKQLKSKDPFGSELNIEEILDINKDKTILTKDDTKISSNKVVFDESYNDNTINKVRENYIVDQYRKDLVRTIYGLQNAGIIVEDYNVKEESSITGTMEEHQVTLRTLDNKTSTFKFFLPKLDKDGTFKLSGQTYLMRFQRLTQVLAKIDTSSVKMCSYYGNYFITKATYKKNDAGYYVMNKLAYLYHEVGSVKDLVMLPSNNEEIKLPLDYAQISRYVKTFKFHNQIFNFEYKKRFTFTNVPQDEILKLEGKNYVLLGTDGKDLLFMDYNNVVYKYDSNFTSLGSIYDVIGIDRVNQPVEHSVMKIFKKVVPTVVLLSYYFGLNNLLKTLKTKYSIVDESQRTLNKYEEIVIRFKDKKLIIQRDFGIGDMILGGLTYISKELREVSKDVLNNKNKFMVLFSKLGYSTLYITEIKNLETLFVDPMTLSLCKELKYPTNFKGLIIKANEMLLDDYYKNPNNITQMSIKGYERICGMLYNELIKSIREYENRAGFSRSKISIPPYSLIGRINDDSTTVLVDDLNPMAAMKQTEDVSYLGAFGFNKDALARESRIYNQSEIGIISEAAKDSGDVGITAYLTAAPKLESTRGVVGQADMSKDGLSTLVSTNALLMPFAMHDDTKRLNFRSPL